MSRLILHAHFVPVNIRRRHHSGAQLTGDQRRDNVARRQRIAIHDMWNLMFLQVFRENIGRFDDLI